MTDFTQVAHGLLNPIPQYVLGCLPAIAIAGASPMNTFIKKLVWMLRVLGCPFIGVFYSVNIGGKEEPRCLFWLPAKCFITNEGKEPPYRPVGLYTMKPNENQDIKEHVNRCTAKASVLEKFSAIISMYYVVIGALAGISRTTGSYVCEDWPYIPLLLSWTLPALWRRIFYGNLVVKDPKIEFNNITIIMEDIPEIRKHKRVTVTLIAFIFIVLPWLTLFLAYFTPPIGYYCRSKYITTICAIWSFNSILAYIWHLKGEKDLINSSILHGWYSLWGLIVTLLLFVLGLLNKNPKWWVGLFGYSCDESSSGCFI